MMARNDKADVITTRRVNIISTCCRKKTFCVVVSTNMARKGELDVITARRVNDGEDRRGRRDNDAEGEY
jgi:hypothetical protein